MPDKDANARRAYFRAYYVAHREEMAAKDRAYHAAHREEKAAYSRAYYVANWDTLAQAKRAKSAHRRRLDTDREYTRRALGLLVAVGELSKRADAATNTPERNTPASAGNVDMAATR